MAGRGRGKGKGKRDGLTLQLPSHIQNSLNKEERMLQQTLGDIDRETKHKLKCISQDQQVAATKLKILERRLLMSQARSRSATQGGYSAARERQSERKSAFSRMDTCDSSYFKSLMTPARMDTTDLFEEAKCGTLDFGGRPRRISVIGGGGGGSALKRPQKSALKRREGEGSAGEGGGGGERRRSSVSFSAGSDYNTRRKSVSFR